MGIGFRVFFVDSDDRLHRTPLKRFERLVLRKDSPERFPEFAGRRVRYAFITVEIEDRKPVCIRRSDYCVLKFTREGKIDRAERDRSLRLVMSMMPPLMPETKGGSVVDASSRFFKKRYDHEFKWQPSPEIEEAIVRAIFSG